MYIDLKLFRMEHGNMLQSKLGEHLGIGQSVVSRMEKQHTDLSTAQYKKLCDVFGKDDVDRYISVNPLTNVIQTIRTARRKRLAAEPPMEKKGDTENTQDHDGLVQIIKSQQEEIIRLNQRIADLTEIIIEKSY